MRVASRKSCFPWHGSCLCMAYEPVVLHWLGGSPAGVLARCAVQVGSVPSVVDGLWADFRVFG